ncbi:UNVERIFIED_CONTAM: Fn3 domain-containing protein [Acetivibrio alkalicellulosi]
MIKQKISLLLISLLISGAIFTSCSSNKKINFPNVDFGDIELSDIITFSHSGGFYEEEFPLYINMEDQDVKIYYTLDGSEPTTDSHLYEQHIQIKRRDNDPDFYSLIDQTSDTFYPPLQPVNKAVIVRARAFNGDIPTSQIITSTYFIGSEEKDPYTLPVISLVSDPYNLFDYNNGIYVKGKYYDELYDRRQQAWEREGNFSQRGRDWERDVHIEYFNSDNKLAFSQNAGVRIHGGATRTYNQKSLRLYAREEYGNEFFEYPFFQGRKVWQENHVADAFKTVVLRNSGNDSYSTMFRDAMMQSLVEHTSLDIQAYSPVIVFLNGEYWGIYNIRERFDKHYFASYYGIDPNQLVILENDGELYEGIAEDEEHYRKMIDYITNNSMEDSIHYQYISSLIDIDNYIDYYVSQIFFDNTDWPGNNNRFWRVRKDGFDPDSPYGHDGRWRWLLFDTDFGFGLYPYHGGYDNNTLIHATKTDGPQWPNPDWSTLTFRSLLKNENFKNQFINRYADHLNTSFKTETVVKRIHEFKSLLEPEIDEHRLRWPSKPSWEENVDTLFQFAINRPQIQRHQIISFFDLEGDSEITLNVSDTSKGYIKINSIDINDGSHGIESPVYPWNGTYFNNVPINITAIPMEGYNFVRWEGSIQETDETISILLNRDITLKAVFE